VTSGAGRATPVLPKLEAPLGPQIAELVIGRLSHILLAAWCPALSLRFAPGDGSVGRLFFDLIARHGRSIPSVASPFLQGRRRRRPGAASGHPGEWRASPRLAWQIARPNPAPARQDLPYHDEIARVPLWRVKAGDHPVVEENLQL
jgi:hypothetical protein